MSGKSALGPGTVILERYRLVSQLGRGGYGVVYKAEQLATGQFVAVKVLLLDKVRGAREETEVARFTREMKLIAHLTHPNIVRLIDSGRLDDGRLFIVLEFIQGVALSTLLLEGSVPVGQTMRLMHQVLEALRAAHEQGVIHRDLKPQNIMVQNPGPRCHARVLDFGISFISEEAREKDYRTLTARDEVAGTPGYMAPEQLIRGEVSPATDVFAFGLVLLETLTGTPAINETSLIKLVLRHSAEVPIEIPEPLLLSPFGRILVKSLAADPDDRFQTIDSVLEAFEAIDLKSFDVERLERALRDAAPPRPPTGRTIGGAAETFAETLDTEAAPSSEELARGDAWSHSAETLQGTPPVDQLRVAKERVRAPLGAAKPRVGSVAGRSVAPGPPSAGAAPRPIDSSDSSRPIPSDRVILPQGLAVESRPLVAESSSLATDGTGASLRNGSGDAALPSGYERTQAAPAASAAAHQPNRGLIIGAGLVIAILTGLVVYLVTTRGADTVPAQPEASPTVDSVPSQQGGRPVERPPGSGPPAPHGPPPGVRPGELPPMLMARAREVPYRGMVRIAGDSFVMGCNPAVDPRCEADERPAHEVEVDAFELDVTEVSVAAYAACVAEQVCQPPDPYQPGRNPTCNWLHPERLEHPVNCITWYQAQLYCEWLGKRLPTEAEWERAARGRDGRLYPWGDQEPNCELAAMTTGEPNCTQRTTRPVGSVTGGASPYGVLDMAGNVWEWTADWYGRDYYSGSPRRNPTGPPGGEERVGRGGGFDDDGEDMRITGRGTDRPWETDDDMGFRCARSVGP